MMSRADIARAGAARAKYDEDKFDYLAERWRQHSEAEGNGHVARAVEDIAEAYDHLKIRMGALCCFFERLADAVEGEEDDNLKAEGIDS